VETAGQGYQCLAYRGQGQGRAAAGSEALLSIMESLWLQISPYFNLLHGSGNYAVSNEQHEAMLNAIRVRAAARRATDVR
jgi:DNA-binding FadR family transcriptional regulator